MIDLIQLEKPRLLADQMAEDGSFPRELQRTKPYIYSAFNLTLFTLICQALSNDAGDLFHYRTPDGKSLARGYEFLFPYLQNKNAWPYGRDIQGFEEQPLCNHGLLFAGLAFDKKEYIEVWKALRDKAMSREGERNTVANEPLLWLRPFNT